MNNDFSQFFHEATPEEKRKLLTQVIKEANQDQRKIMGHSHGTPLGACPDCGLNNHIYIPPTR